MFCDSGSGPSAVCGSSPELRGFRGSGLGHKLRTIFGTSSVLPWAMGHEASLQAKEGRMVWQLIGCFSSNLHPEPEAVSQVSEVPSMSNVRRFQEYRRTAREMRKTRRQLLHMPKQYQLVSSGTLIHS